MSTEEQDAIVGRLVREYSEAKKAIAVLLAEADKWGRAYHAAGSYLCSTNENDGGLRFGTLATRTEGIPDLDKVQKLCVETLMTIERKKELFALLKQMGHEPPRDS
jgi:hypothetical protein